MARKTAARKYDDSEKKIASEYIANKISEQMVSGENPHIDPANLLFVSISLSEARNLKISTTHSFSDIVNIATNHTVTLRDSSDPIWMKYGDIDPNEAVRRESKNVGELIIEDNELAIACVEKYIERNTQRALRILLRDKPGNAVNLSQKYEEEQKKILEWISDLAQEAIEHVKRGKD